MKKRILNIAIALLAMLTHGTAAHAQLSEEYNKAAAELMRQATEMMRQSQVNLQTAPQYADSIGIYAPTAKGWKRIEPIKSHHSTVNATAFLVQSKLQFAGAKAKLRFDSVAVFRFYFGIPRPEVAGKYYMFMPDKSVNDFSIVEFIKRKNARRLRMINLTLFVGSHGPGEAGDVSTEVEEIREGVYELRISGAHGEYGITYAANGMAGHSGVYDFGLDPAPGQYVGYWDK